MNKMTTKALYAAAIGATLCTSAIAADWSDTSISLRTGNSYREPVNANNITKDIINFSHISGYAYGTNFFSVDLLMSDKKDSVRDDANYGSQETYLVYRHTLDIGKIKGTPIAFGPFRGVGVTLGFDWNTKNNSYGSRKRQLVVGPSLMFDVPGFLNMDLLVLNESNASSFTTSRYTYKTHLALNFAWGIPISTLPLSFEGFANFIAAKGDLEDNRPSKAETNIDMKLMYDIGSSSMGMRNKAFRIGIEYQYWNNKFGNDNSNPFYLGGAKATTPQLIVDYHF